MRSCRVYLFVAAATAVFAQDSLRVVSPNGRIEAVFGVALPAEPLGAFPRLAYQVSFDGKPLIDRSYMGYWIHEQEPILGQNLGLSTSGSSKGPGYNAATGEFLQNGSLGRRINVEMRVFDEGLAFRYLIPRTSTLEDLRIDTEETEFHFASDGEVQLASGRKIALNALHETVSLPLKVEQPGLGWVTLAESHAPGYPNTLIEPREPALLATRLDAAGKEISIVGTTPFTGVWRILLIGTTPVDPTVAAKYLK
jgi:hypothetical protein